MSYQMKPYILMKKDAGGPDDRWHVTGEPIAYDSMDEIYAKHGVWWADSYALFRRYNPRLRKIID